MSTYYYTIDGELRYKDKDANNILDSIMKEVSSERWCRYGWVDTIKNAACLQDVFEVMGICMEDTGVDGEIAITLYDTYKSDFLRTMLKVALPWILDSRMVVKNDSDDVIQHINVKDHKLVPVREADSLKYTVVSYWIGEEGDTNVWLYDSEKEAVEAMNRLYEKSYKSAQEDDNFDGERSYHEKHEARVAWTDELYRVFEVRPISTKEEI